MALMGHEPRSLRSRSREESEEAVHNWMHDEHSAVKPTWVPAVAVRELEDRFEFHVSLPDVDPSHVEITLDTGAVLESAPELVGESAAIEESSLIVRAESKSGRFYRRFVLPATADASRMNTSCRRGLLQITVPKHSKSLT